MAVEFCSILTQFPISWQGECTLRGQISRPVYTFINLTQFLRIEGRNGMPRPFCVHIYFVFKIKNEGNTGCIWESWRRCGSLTKYAVEEQRTIQEVSKHIIFDEYCWTELAGWEQPRLIRTGKVLVSDLGQTTAILSEISRGFPQLLKARSGMIPRLDPYRILSISSFIRHELSCYLYTCNLATGGNMK